LPDDFGKTLAHLEERGMLGRLPDSWRALLAKVIVPLRRPAAAPPRSPRPSASGSTAPTCSRCGG
jgi:hypothetical protein